MTTAYAKDVFWWKSNEKKPEPNISVLVHGGLASWDGLVWKTQTGEDSGRVIQWPVMWWAEIPKPPENPDAV